MAAPATTVGAPPPAPGLGLQLGMITPTAAPSNLLLVSPGTYPPWQVEGSFMSAVFMSGNSQGTLTLAASDAAAMPSIVQTVPLPTSTTGSAIVEVGGLLQGATGGIATLIVEVHEASGAVLSQEEVQYQLVDDRTTALRYDFEFDFTSHPGASLRYQLRMETAGTYTFSAPYLGLVPLFAADTMSSSDVIVYGGTPSGVLAAVQAARLGAKVTLIEPSKWLGGEVSGGLSATDSGTSRVIGGMAAEFFMRTAYEEGLENGIAPGPVLDAGSAITALFHQVDTVMGLPTVQPDGGLRKLTPVVAHPSFFDLEPHVATKIFAGMVSNANLSTPINVVMNSHLLFVQKTGTNIDSITTNDGKTYSARMFIDAGYEGDLMAATGVSYTWGRESNTATYNGETGTEIDAGYQYLVQTYGGLDAYVTPGDPKSGVIGGVRFPDPVVNESVIQWVQAYAALYPTTIDMGLSAWLMLPQYAHVPPTSLSSASVIAAKAAVDAWINTWNMTHPAPPTAENTLAQWLLQFPPGGADLKHHVMAYNYRLSLTSLNSTRSPATVSYEALYNANVPTGSPLAYPAYSDQLFLGAQRIIGNGYASPYPMGTQFIGPGSVFPYITNYASTPATCRDPSCLYDIYSNNTKKVAVDGGSVAKVNLDVTDIYLNSKWDVNGLSIFSSDQVNLLDGTSIDDYVDGDEKIRQRVRDQSEYYILGLSRFLTEYTMAGTGISSYMKFGECGDEFADNHNFPPQLYVREGRRMIGTYVVTENNVLLKSTLAPDDDVIGLAYYNMDTHTHQVLAIGSQIYIEGQNEPLGYGQNNVESGTPYPIPLRALEPMQTEAANLLVSVTVSSTAEANHSIRVEPTYMMLGQAAGAAAAVAIQQQPTGQVIVQSLPYHPVYTALTTVGSNTYPQILKDPKNDAGIPAPICPGDCTPVLLPW